MRIAIVLATLATAALAAAAPVPKGQSEAERIVKLFGKPVDPDKDCKFNLDGDKLVITLPDKPHALEIGMARRTNAPRVVKDVTGDFAARVKMQSRLPPDGEQFTTFAAGLVVYQDDDNFARMEAVRLMREGTGQMMTQFIVAGKGMGGCGMGDGKAGPTTLMWLKLTRRGDVMDFAVSYDQVSWHWFSRETGVTLGRELKVGVFAANAGYIGNAGTAGFTATFEDFTVEPLTDTQK